LVVVLGPHGAVCACISPYDPAKRSHQAPRARRQVLLYWLRRRRFRGRDTILSRVIYGTPHRSAVGAASLSSLIASTWAGSRSHERRGFAGGLALQHALRAVEILLPSPISCWPSPSWPRSPRRAEHHDRRSASGASPQSRHRARSVLALRETGTRRRARALRPRPRSTAAATVVPNSCPGSCRTYPRFSLANGHPGWMPRSSSSPLCVHRPPPRGA